MIELKYIFEKKVVLKAGCRDPVWLIHLEIFTGEIAFSCIKHEVPLVYTGAEPTMRLFLFLCLFLFFFPFLLHFCAPGKKIS